MQIRTRTGKNGDTATSFIRWTYSPEKRKSVSSVIGTISDLAGDHSALLAEMTPEEQEDFNQWLETTKTGIERDQLSNLSLTSVADTIQKAIELKAIQPKTLEELTKDAKEILSLLKKAGRQTAKTQVSSCPA